MTPVMVLSPRRRVMRWEWRHCSQSDPVACERFAARKYRQPVWLMECVARAESTQDPTNTNNPDYHGLYQYGPSAWEQTPYRRHSWWSARWSSLATGWMFQHGQQDQWQTITDGSC